MIVDDDSVSLFRINGLFFSALFAGTVKISPSYFDDVVVLNFVVLELEGTGTARHQKIAARASGIQLL